MLGMSLEPRRSPHPRRQGQLLRQGVQGRPVRARPGDGRDRLRTSRAPRPRTQAQAGHRRVLGILAGRRLGPLPGRLPTRWVRISWWTWRTSPASWPRACTRTRCRTPTSWTTTTQQDAARPARRPDPCACQRRDHQEAQFADLPGHAGWSADARHRRQGRGVPRGAATRVQGLPAAGGRQRPRHGENADGSRLQDVSGGTDNHLFLVD